MVWLSMGSWMGLVSASRRKRRRSRLLAERVALLKGALVLVVLVVGRGRDMTRVSVSGYCQRHRAWRRRSEEGSTLRLVAESAERRAESGEWSVESGERRLKRTECSQSV